MRDEIVDFYSERWSPEDQGRALNCENWLIGKRVSDGCVNIYQGIMVNSISAFESTEAARTFVYKKALEGSSFHRRALAAITLRK